MMNNEVKKDEPVLNNEINPRDHILEDIPVPELLGSVTTYSNQDGCDRNQQLRSSARVSKKIKLDANCPPTVEKIEKKEEQKPDPKKCLRPIWTSDDKTLFFEALNEYGKDFENIHSYMIQKLKKKCVPDTVIKTKEQVRHLYYRTWHKISKYLKYSEGIKKVVQELYGLINYGELRKKTGIFRHKNCMKLNELIYNGCVTIRVKGKTVRVKTPMCRALRALNQLDDKYDELKLPSRVIVELRPKDMTSFFKVQSMALNPRVRTILPLQKRLSTFIGCVSKRWRAAETAYISKETYPFLHDICKEDNLDISNRLITPQLKFNAPKEMKIETPAINLGEYFTRQSISLKAYEDRMGIVSSEYILSLLNDKKETQKRTGHKIRSDSITENIEISPLKSEVDDNENLSNIDFTKLEPDTSACIDTITPNIELIASPRTEIDDAQAVSLTIAKVLDSVVDLNEAITTILSLTNPSEDTTSDEQHDIVLPNMSPDQKTNYTVCVPESTSIDTKEHPDISLEEQLLQVEKVKNGWTLDDCDTLTIGELYLMFGSNSKVVLEYGWTDTEEQLQNDFSDINEIFCCSNNPNLDLEGNNSFDSISHHFALGNSLRKLVSVAKLQYKTTTGKCTCGHACSPKASVPKKSQDNKQSKLSDSEEKNQIEESLFDSDIIQVTLTGNADDKNPAYDDFLRPISKPPVHLMAQLNSIQKLKPKFGIRRGRRLRTKPLVVERELPLMPHKGSSAHQIVCMNIISSISQTPNTEENDSENMEFENFEEYPTSAETPSATSLTETTSSTTEACSITTNLDNGESRENSQLSELKSHLRKAIKHENLAVLSQDSRSISPSGLLKENESQWISSEVGDFSLSSFLGHLESPLKSNQINEDDQLSNDVNVQVESLLTESSLDYTSKFADLANKVVSDKTK